jgi:cytochrome c556
MADPDEVRKNISESADKIRVETKVKRGDATRDQDELKVKVKGNDPDDVVEKLNDTIANLHETADEVRDLQPGSGDADE